MYIGGLEIEFREDTIYKTLVQRHFQPRPTPNFHRPTQRLNIVIFVNSTSNSPKLNQMAKTPAKKAAKVAKAAATGDKKKNRKTRHESYATYLHKVLKQVHPGMLCF
jgi:hypothetical protein